MSCERSVRVITVHPNYITVRPVTQVLCSACELVGHCHSDWFRQKSPEQTFEIPVSDPISVKVGDIVLLSLDDYRLGLQVTKVYVPVFTGLVVPIIFGQSQGWSEITQASAAVVGISLGWLVSRHWSRNFRIRVNR